MFYPPSWASCMINIFVIIRIKDVQSPDHSNRSPSLIMISKHTPYKARLPYKNLVGHNLSSDKTFDVLFNFIRLSCLLYTFFPGQTRSLACHQGIICHLRMETVLDGKFRLNQQLACYPWFSCDVKYLKTIIQIILPCWFMGHNKFEVWKIFFLRHILPSRSYIYLRLYF